MHAQTAQQWIIQQIKPSVGFCPNWTLTHNQQEEAAAGREDRKRDGAPR